MEEKGEGRGQGRQQEETTGTRGQSTKGMKGWCYGKQREKCGLGIAFWSPQFALPWPLLQSHTDSCSSDKGLQKRDPGQTHPGSSLRMYSEEQVRSGARVKGLSRPWGTLRSWETWFVQEANEYLCQTRFSHTHVSFQNQSLPNLWLPSQPLGWKSTEQYLTDSYGPGLYTSRDLPASVGQDHSSRKEGWRSRILVKVTLEEAHGRWSRYGAVHLSHQMLGAWPLESTDPF